MKAPRCRFLYFNYFSGQFGIWNWHFSPNAKTRKQNKQKNLRSRFSWIYLDIGQIYSTAKLMSTPLEVGRGLGGFLPQIR